MCDCMNKVLEQVKDRVMGRMSHKIDHDSFEMDYQGKVFRLSGNSDNNVMIPINYSYIRVKNDDTPYANKTKNTISLAMCYCPMCGVKFEEETKS